jgi:hypothetical protein
MTFVTSSASNGGADAHLEGELPLLASFNSHRLRRDRLDGVATIAESQDVRRRDGAGVGHYGSHQRRAVEGRHRVADGPSEAAYPRCDNLHARHQNCGRGREGGEHLFTKRLTCGDECAATTVRRGHVASSPSLRADISFA